jgi:hypothetical protein
LVAFGCVVEPDSGSSEEEESADWDIGVARSTDDGVTWSAAVALNADAREDLGHDAGSQLAADGLGTWIAVWHSNAFADPFREDYDVLLARSTDGGVTWTGHAELNTNAGSDAESDFWPHVTTDGQGTWVAAWYSLDSLGDTIGADRDILVARSTDDGVTWTAPAPLNANAAIDAGDDYRPRVTTDGRGTWVATWYSLDSLGDTIGMDRDILVARSTDDGATWTSPAPLNANAAIDAGDDYWPQLTTDGQGTWIATWYSGDSLGDTIGTDWDILAARSTDDGATWTAPAPLNTNAGSDGWSDYRPQLTTDSRGTWIATWYSWNPLRENFGRGVAALGDLDGDGVGDLAVGAPGDDAGGANRGAVWVLFLNPDASVKSHQKISDTQGGFTGSLNDSDLMGWHVKSIGDHDGDGVGDLAVGARGDDDGGPDRGAVWLLFLDPNGTVKAHQKISDTQGGFAGTLDDQDTFGFGITSLGDHDGDGVGDLAVGAWGDDDGGVDRGAVWLLFLNANGTVKGHQKISDTQGGFAGNLSEGDRFGQFAASLGDLDGDGVGDLAVTARGDDDGGEDRGAVWILFLSPDGTLKSHQKISDTEGGFSGMLDDGDWFGTVVTALGDLDGDGVGDLAVGAADDDDGGVDRGAVWVLFLNSNGTVKSHQKISDTQGGFPGSLSDFDHFGSPASLGDFDADGVIDLAVGAHRDDDGGEDRGAVWIFFLNPNGTVKSHQKISSTQGGFTGRLGVTTGTDADILMARSLDDGVTWTAPAALNTNAASDAEDDYGPQLATDERGTWVAVWDSLDSLDDTIGADRDILVARSLDDGVTWTAPVALNSDAASDVLEDELAQITTDGQGTWVAVWEYKDL